MPQPVNRSLIKEYMRTGRDTADIAASWNVHPYLSRVDRPWREADVWNILARTDFALDRSKVDGYVPPNQPV